MGNEEITHRIRQGEAWTPDSPALVVLEIVPDDSSNAKGTVLELRAHFRPYRIPRGNVVKSIVYFGSTGAFVRLEARGGTFLHWTREPKETAKQSIEEKKSSGIQFNPRLRLEFTGLGKAEAEVGSRSSSNETVSRLEFVDPTQANLSDKCIDQKYIEWHYTLHRGAKRVRDFLEESLHLAAKCQWIGASKRLSATAELDDCGFFGLERRPLTAFKAYALLLALKANGVVLPGAGKVVCDVDFA
jgi:hypothetical protein